MANEFAIRSTLMNTISSYIQFDNKFVNIIASILIVGVISRIMNNPTYILEYFSFDALKRWWKSSKKSITIKSTKYVSEKGGFTQSDEDRNANDKIRAITHFLHKNNLFAKHNELMVSDPPPDKNYKNDKEMLKDRKISLLPASVVKYKDIEVHYYANNRTADKDGKMSENNKEIKIYGQTPERCMEFIKMCHDEWVDEYYQDDEDESKKRYIYIPCYDGGKILKHKRYELSTEKTFDNIFLPEKDEIIRRLDRLKNKSGVYSLTGILRREGFCLEGEPGTGKTTVAKVIASYMNYDVVVIDLDNITYGSSIIDLFHNNRIMCVDLYEEERTWRSNKNERVYLLDDIDADNPLVSNRKVTKDEKEKEREKVLEMFKMIGKKDDDEKPTKIYDYFKMNSFTLTELLTAIDGPLELQDVVFIMTTNEISKLDPALIRPGRFGFPITFKKMRVEEIHKFMKFHFEFDCGSYELLDEKITPSQLEDFCKLTMNPNEIMEKVMEKMK